MVQVAFLIGNLNKEHGGAQQLLYDLCRHLPKDEFDLTVYYMFGEGTFQPDLEAAGTGVVALEADSNYDPRAFVRLVRHLRREQPDVLHTNSPISGAWGRVAGRIAGISHILSVQHNIHDSRRPLARAVDDLTLPLADSIVGVSEAVPASFTPWERALFDRTIGHVETIPNGVNVDAIAAGRQDDNEVLDPYPVEPSDPIIGTVGRHIKQKGYRYLIDAMERVIHEHPDAKLLLISDGPERRALERRARQRGLVGADSENSVIFTGYVDSVPPFLAHFDLAVFPSVYEGFGIALAEAMAADTPVIGTDIPPFRRLLDSGDAGVLVPPRDSDALAEAINALLADDSRREQLRVRGRERVEREFSIENTARQYAELYRNAVNR